MNVNFCSSGYNSYYEEKSGCKFWESTAALGAFAVPSWAGNKEIKKIAGKLPEASSGVLPEDIISVEKSAEKILRATGLKKCGVSIDDWSKKIVFFPNKIVKSIIDGKNAAFVMSKEKMGGLKGNSVLINMKKLPAALFHELGHAYNFNKSEFWRGMQKLRMPGMILGVILSLVPALTSSKKSKNGQELSFGDKINNTLRESAPALAFLSFTPAIAEEGMATIRGNSWAKRLLDPELYKRVVKSNKYGLLTYVLAGAGLAISSWCGKVVKDKLCD